MKRIHANQPSRAERQRQNEESKIVMSTDNLERPAEEAKDDL